MSTHNERVLVDRPRVTESVAKQSPRTRLRRGRPVRSRRQRHGQLDHLLLDDGAGHQGGLSCALGGGLSTRCAGIRRSGQNSGARDQGTTCLGALPRAPASRGAEASDVGAELDPKGGRCFKYRPPLGWFQAIEIRPTRLGPPRRQARARALRLIWHPGAPARLLLPAPAAAATVPPTPRLGTVPSGSHGGCSDSSRAPGIKD